MCVANLTDKLIFYGPHKPIIYVTLHFIGHLSCNKVKHLIKSIIIKKKRMFDLKFEFLNNFTIGSLFKIKDCISLNIKSHVMYHLDCLSCPAGYIGVTTHLLPARMQEHRYALKGMRFSAVAEYSLRKGHSKD